MCQLYTCTDGEGGRKPSCDTMPKFSSFCDSGGLTARGDHMRYVRAPGACRTRTFTGATGRARHLALAISTWPVPPAHMCVMPCFTPLPFKVRGAWQGTGRSLGGDREEPGRGQGGSLHDKMYSQHAAPAKGRMMEGLCRHLRARAAPITSRATSRAARTTLR